MTYRATCAAMNSIACVSILALCFIPAMASARSASRVADAIAPAATPAQDSAPASDLRTPSVSFGPAPYVASEPIWISEAAPWEARRIGATERDKTGSDGEHDHAATGAATKASQTAMSEARNSEAAAEAMVDMSSHSGAKTLWLRQGDDPATAPMVKARGQRVSLRVLGTNGSSWDSEFADVGKGGMQAKIDLPQMGFFSAYVQRQSVRGGVRDVEVAKAELLKANCCSKRDFDLYKPAVDEASPIELIREHKADEKAMTRIQSGDKAVYLLRSYGKPVEGARVTIQTQEGWRKRAFTDAQGRVEFTIARDYFPDWNDFNRRKSGTFLVLAEFERPESGALDGASYASTRYRASMAGRYYPATYDYQSYGYGLGIVVAVFGFGGLAVWIHRQRRARPFREVVFDERLV